MKILNPEIAVSDERGFLKEISKGFQWKQLNHTSTKKGSIRGNHYHKKTLELFYILKGKIELNVKDLKTNEESVHHLQKGSCFIIEPYEIHTLKYLTDVETIVLLSEIFNQEDPDIYKE